MRKRGVLDVPSVKVPLARVPGGRGARRSRPPRAGERRHGVAGVAGQEEEPEEVDLPSAEGHQCEAPADAPRMTGRPQKMQTANRAACVAVVNSTNLLEEVGLRTAMEE